MRYKQCTPNLFTIILIHEKLVKKILIVTNVAIELKILAMDPAVTVYELEKKNYRR